MIVFCSHLLFFDMKAGFWAQKNELFYKIHLKNPLVYMIIYFYVNKILIVEWCSDENVRITFKNPIDEKDMICIYPVTGTFYSKIPRVGSI